MGIKSFGEAVNGWRIGNLLNRGRMQRGPMQRMHTSIIKRTRGGKRSDVTILAADGSEDNLARLVEWIRTVESGRAPAVKVAGRMV